LSLDSKKASGFVAGLLALTGVLGVIILATDQILRTSLGGLHWYGLVGMVVVDFAVAIFVKMKPTRMGLTIAAAWAILRVLLQLGDVTSAPSLQMGYGDFANYLFNPTLVTSPNPPGVPAALIDLIIILELIVVGVALSGRASQKS
jgi:hypothetical protein